MSRANPGNPELLGITVARIDLPRIEIAARLKAARWLAGGVDDDGRPTALSVVDLIDREPLRANEFTKNRLESIEQTTAKARPFELEKIAEALGLAHSYFTDPALAGLIERPTASGRSKFDEMGPRGLGEIQSDPDEDEHEDDADNSVGS